MLRKGFLTGLLWLAMGTGAWAGEPERTFHNCGEVIAIAEPLMPVDAFEQLLMLSETECMDMFGDYTPVELSHMLAKEVIHVSVDNDIILYIKNPKSSAVITEVVPPQGPIGPWQQGVRSVLDWLSDAADTAAEFMDSLYNRLFGHTHDLH